MANTGTSALDHDRFFSLSLDMLCIADFQGYFKDLNPAWERVLGWTPEELRASPFVEFVHPDDQAATIAEAAKLATATDTVWFENRYRCKDESYKWLAWRATASIEDQLIYAVASDVTDQKNAEAKLARLLDSERRLASDLRLLLESTAEGIYGIDLDGRCTFVNPAAAEMLGYDEAQVVGSNVHLLVHHSHPDGSAYPIEECPIFRAFRTGEGCRVDNEVLWRSDASSFPVEYSSFPFVEEGVIRGAVVTFRDITESKAAEEAIVAERNRLAAILASMAEGAVITDGKGRIVSVNPAMERLGGWREDEVRGRRFADVYPAFDEQGDSIPIENRFLSKAIQSREAVASRGYGLTFLWRDGRRCPVNVSAAPIFDADGDVLGAVSVVRDVSYERQFERERESMLQEHANTARQLDLLLESTDQGIFGVDLQGRCTFMNRAGIEMLGLALEEIQGELAHSVIQPQRSDGSIYLWDESPTKETIRTGSSARVDDELFRRKDGAFFPVEYSSHPLVSEGQVQGAVVTFSDITNRKQLEERVRLRTIELEAANKELESFSYSVSHDLRAPLRSIDGFSKILMEDHSAELSEEALKHLDRVRASTQRMGQLVDDLLEFARLGKQDIRRSNVDLNALVEAVLREDLKAEIDDRDVQVTVHELAKVSADAGLLRQVFFNLISNALKFTRYKDQGVIEIGSSNGTGPPTYYVKDNGAGFDMAYVDKLFGVFQRLHPQELFEGNGVGLAMVQRIINRHGGRIWAESEKDAGTTFFMTIGEENRS